MVVIGMEIDSLAIAVHQFLFVSWPQGKKGRSCQV
jgi:hypothetical protein